MKARLGPCSSLFGLNNCRLVNEGAGTQFMQKTARKWPSELVINGDVVACYRRLTLRAEKRTDGTKVLLTPKRSLNAGLHMSHEPTLEVPKYISWLGSIAIRGSSHACSRVVRRRPQLNVDKDLVLGSPSVHRPQSCERKVSYPSSSRFG